MSPRRLAVNIAILALFLVPSFATTVVAVFQRTPDGQQRIVLGADGLQTQVGEDRVHVKPVCKIGHAGPFFYAVAGTIYSPDRKYDAYREIGRILSTSTLLDERSRGEIERTLSTEIAGADFPEQMGGLVAEILIVDSAHFPTYYMGTLVRIAQGFEFAPGAGVRTKSLANSDDDTHTVILGIHDHAGALFKANPHVTGNPPGGIQELIHAEADQHPNEVGEPISMVEITRDGIKWLLPGHCTP